MKRLTPTAVEDLLEIFVRRFEKGAIILTTNRTLEDWGHVLGKTAAAGVSWTASSAPCRGHQAVRKKLSNA